MEVGAQFSWVEMDRAGWSWVEVDGAGWRSMHPPPSTYIKLHPALRLAIQKTIVGIRISISIYHVCQFLGKMNNFEFFGPNLPKKGFRVRN